MDMLRTADNISKYMESFYNAKLEIGIGIHYGEAVIGTIGSCNKRQKTETFEIRRDSLRLKNKRQRD